jgi:hypothetical protein
MRQDQGDADKDGTKKGADEKNPPPILTKESLPSPLDSTLRELPSQACHAILIGNIRETPQPNRPSRWPGAQRYERAARSYCEGQEPAFPDERGRYCGLDEAEGWRDLRVGE